MCRRAWVVAGLGRSRGLLVSAYERTILFIEASAISGAAGLTPSGAGERCAPAIVHLIDGSRALTASAARRIRTH